MKLSLKTRIVPGGVAALALVAGSIWGASPALADFSYANFNSIGGLVLNGAAIQSAPTLSVTPAVRASAGSFWRSDQQSISNGFDTTFSFRVRDISGIGADGFAFVIQNSAAGNGALGGGGGALGYGTNEVYPELPGNTGISNCIAVEFDMWDNTGQWGDFGSAQSISIQTNGTGDNRPSSGFSRGHYNAPTDFGDNLIHTARVSYTPGVMSVYIDNLLAPVLTVAIDIGGTINLTGGQAFVGFTSGTGALANAQRHEVLSWDFGTTIVPTPAAASLLATGGLLIARRRRR